MTEFNETKFIEQIQNESTRRQAFSLAIKTFQKPIYWQIRKMVLSHEDADDVLQNTFLKAWKNIDNFRGESKLSTWLYRIAINECITFLNKQKQEQEDCIHQGDDYLFANLQSDPYFDGDEIQKLLQKAILTLPEKQRLVFNMRYFDEMKYEEMSSILGTSTGALKASYHIAANKIIDFMRAHV